MGSLKLFSKSNLSNVISTMPQLHVDCWKKFIIFLPVTSILNLCSFLSNVCYVGEVNFTILRSIFDAAKHKKKLAITNCDYEIWF